MLKKMSEVEALRYCENAILLKEKIETGFLEYAKALYTIKTERLYEGQYGSFDVYLDASRVGKSKAEQLIRIYEKLCLSLQIKNDTIVKAGGWSVVVRLLPLITTKDSAIEVLEKASTMQSRSAIVKWTKEAVEDNYINCGHNNYYTIKICKDCGEKFKIDDSDPQE